MDTPSRESQVLERFITAQAQEFQQRHELYGERAKVLEDFPAAADTLHTPFDFRARSFGMAAELKVILHRLNPSGRAPLQILDSGCGVGTHSLLFAAFGNRVTGVDLNTALIDLAHARVRFYADQLACPIECTFVAKNIFKESLDPVYDLVWAREAISHFHPLEDYLRRVRAILKPGGVLIISDENWSNPLVKLDLFREYGRHYRPFRGRGESPVYFVTERQDPETGETVPMAMERVLSLAQTRKKFRQAGFTDVHGVSIGLVPKATTAKFLTRNAEQRERVFNYLLRLENALLALPWIRSLGRTNLVVGRNGQ